jgi:hypothetical protein
MANSDKPPGGRKAGDIWAQADRRDKWIREENEKARAASAAKTAKLRALRLAKEAADRQAEQERQPENPAKSHPKGNRTKTR